jgi:hypothetical protein
MIRLPTPEHSAFKDNGVEPDRLIESAERPGKQIKSFNRMTELLRHISYQAKPGKSIERMRNMLIERKVIWIRMKVEEPDERRI